MTSKMNNTQNTEEVIRAAMDAELRQNQLPVDLDNTEGKVEKKKSEPKPVEKTDDLEQLRKDMFISQSDDDDFDLSDSSSIIVTKVARREQIKPAQPKEEAGPKESNSRKRPAIIQLKEPRMTKHRMKVLEKIR